MGSQLIRELNAEIKNKMFDFIKYGIEGEQSPNKSQYGRTTQVTDRIPNSHFRNTPSHH